MPLHIKSIQLRDFRRYDELSLDGIGRLTIFVGPNAVGKTSIIEAIQLLTALSTLRHCTADELIRFGAEGARVEAQVGDGNRQLDIALTIADKSRKYTLNGKAKRLSDLRGLVPAVVFSPDDLDLVKGSHGNRRRAIDQLGIQLNANYLQLTHDFEKIQRHKTKLLKDQAPAELLEAVNETFARVSAQLTNYRARMFERLLPHIQRMYSQIANFKDESAAAVQPSTPPPVTEELTGAYAASWEHADGNPADLAEAIQLRMQEERTRGRALEGAHLDTISFAINGMDAHKFASQGQQRSLVLAWKLAEVELIDEMLGNLPILLLDDVMSELDSNRRAALMRYLTRDLQVFITTTNADHFTGDMLEQADIIQLPLQ